MSTHDPSGPQPEGGGQPSSDKRPPTPGGGTPEGEPPRPTPSEGPSGTPGGTPSEGPGAYRGNYGGPTHGQTPHGQPPHGGQPYDQPPPGYGTGPGMYGTPGGGPVPGMPPIGTWPKRIIARLIDYVLIQAVGVIVVGLFVDLGTRQGSTEAFWLGCAIYLVYEALMLSRDGQTLGKKAMKIRVAMLIDGNVPAQSAAWTRAAVYILPAVLCCAALWWIIDGLFGVFDSPYRQCIHDKAAKTVVVTTEV
ncbi:MULTISPECIES: RDD family protein [Kitasatospora]|uniref:RDD family protein n=1 Tax=Kitasatospora cathayae TaxID=3004092 RepID=A0ABY7Q7J1_9ACTN|nr:RDD family protein [Kitasatospora sp. HUAS 3-15]WBP88640.1 RDD family protein [Kitasatospora sp. HUAS 3-15]